MDENCLAQDRDKLRGKGGGGITHGNEPSGT